jgi:hypothetical protein
MDTPFPPKAQIRRKTLKCISSGDFTADLGTASYTSDFTSTANGWVDGGGGAPVIAANQTVESVEDCLKVTGTAGGDAFVLDNASKTTNNGYYCLELDYYASDAGDGVANDVGFLGLGDNGDHWNPGYDHDAGWNHTVVLGSWQSNVRLYGKADGTTLELCGYTTKNGQTRDTIAENAFFGFKNMTLHAISNITDWTLSAEADGAWDWNTGNLDFDASGAATATQTQVFATTDIAYYSATISDWVAGDLWMTIGGETLKDYDADGTYTGYIRTTTGTDSVVLNGDATGDGAFDSISVKKLMGSTGTAVGSGTVGGHEGNVQGNLIPLSTADALYHSTHRAGLTGEKIITFPAPIWTIGGFWLNFDAPGSACQLDITVYYEVA